MQVATSAAKQGAEKATGRAGCSNHAPFAKRRAQTCYPLHHFWDSSPVCCAGTAVKSSTPSSTQVNCLMDDASLGACCSNHAPFAKRRKDSRVCCAGTAVGAGGRGVAVGGMGVGLGRTVAGGPGVGVSITGEINVRNAVGEGGGVGATTTGAFDAGSVETSSGCTGGEVAVHEVLCLSHQPPTRPRSSSSPTSQPPAAASAMAVRSSRT